PISRVFADLEEDAFAAASIGQVHRARTHDGRVVAVKVQYPGMAEAVEVDLRNLGMLLPLVKRLAPGLDTQALAGELRERIAEELDYEIEAQNHRAIARAWRGHPLVHVPAVDTMLSSRRVLVTELLVGSRFEEVKRLSDAARDRFTEIVFRFFFGTLAYMGRASGDPPHGEPGPLHARRAPRHRRLGRARARVPRRRRAIDAARRARRGLLGPLALRPPRRRVTRDPGACVGGPRTSPDRDDALAR